LDSRQPDDGSLAYHRDSYLTELETEVIGAGDDDRRPFVILADTIFYPEGGGQPADHGLLGETTVVDVQKQGETIIHFVSEPVDKGPVQLKLDWLRRWDHMQQHTGQHMLTAVALRDFGWRTTAFHLGTEWSDIELDVPTLDREDLAGLENRVAAEIRAARPVTYRVAEVADFERLGVRSRLLPDGFEGPVRLVDIEGLDLNTCGGTHCRSTAEVGVLCLLGTEPMRGGTRVFFAAGDRVRRRMAAHEDRNLKLRSLLDTADDQLPDVVALRLERERELARTARRLSEELAEAAAAVLCGAESQVIDEHWPERDMAFLHKVGRTITEIAPDRRALLTVDVADGAQFLVVAGAESGLQLEEIGPRIAEMLDGRGGGRGEIFQGKAKTLANREAVLELLRRS
jgi:alanyl-tRNA synthetase